MRTKIITLCLLLSVLALFTIPAFSQEKKTEEKKTEVRMMQHQPMMMRGQNQMMDMKKMGALMDSSMTRCDMMMQHMKQMNAHDMMGGQMGMNCMMGATQCLKNMAEQMKSMTQNMDKMMTDKEIMSTKEQTEKMKEMRSLMEQTTKNLTQLTDLNQKMMLTMHKQVLKKESDLSERK